VNFVMASESERLKLKAKFGVECHVSHLITVSCEHVFFLSLDLFLYTAYSVRMQVGDHRGSQLMDVW
jgi:hypothetical protein